MQAHIAAEGQQAEAAKQQIEKPSVRPANVLFAAFRACDGHGREIS
jgi:hypothetical protein